MPCGGCNSKMNHETRKLVCLFCSQRVKDGMAYRCRLGGHPEWCPLGKHVGDRESIQWPTCGGVVPRRYRVSWYGSPYPIRLACRILKGFWPRNQKGCGCIKRLKDWYDRRSDPE